MAKKYNIDKNRVYMSGFSMGGMLTYHCMSMIPNTIAAFAPVSGHLMGGEKDFKSPRPLPLIHVHGTSDSVVNYEQSEDYVKGWAKRNGCSSTPVTTQHNNGNPSCKKEVWTDGECETEDVRISFNGRDHEHNNSGALHTSSEIWNFVKNYSLDCGKVGSSGISFSSPSASGKYSDGDVVKFAVKVGGKVEAEKIELTLDGEPFATLDSEPFETEWTAESGNHILKAVATMTDGSEMEVESKFFVNVPQTAYNGKPTVLPAKIEAEEYDLGGEGYAYSDSDDNNEGDAKFRTDEGVDVVVGNGDKAVGYTTSSEWLEYTVEVLKDAEFGIEAEASNGSSDFDIEIQSDGVKLTTLSGKKTSNWDTYATLKASKKVELKAGKHIIKVLFNTNYTNLDYIEFIGEKVPSAGIANATAYAAGITISPNPAQTSFTVHSASLVQEVRIMTMSGSIVAVVTDNDKIDITALPDGIYLVGIKTEETYIVKKVLIEK